MRHLASIQKIHSITPIEGADRIELVHVLGWQCVANKGQFNEGDLAVYFEVDSFLPIREEFEFLRTSSFKHSELLGDGFKLRTQKFRGALSQGLVLPVSILGDIKVAEGDDVTEVLGVREWEEPIRASGNGTIIGGLPSFISKTDETRIQSMPELLNEFAGLEYYITTKMDGTSCSVGLDDAGVLRITGHNTELKYDNDSAFARYIMDKHVEEKLKDFVATHPGTLNISVQGEFCGEGIQKNRLKLQKPEWYVFTISINGKRIPFRDMRDMVVDMGLTMVPVEEVDKDLPSIYPTIEALLKRAAGAYPNGGPKEGIVIRPTVPVYSNCLSTNLSMKVINNKYLLKHDS